MHLVYYATAALEFTGKRRSLQYTKNMSINLTLLHWHQKKSDCGWRLFEKDPGAFNEEVGESSLSFLARHISSQPSRLNDFSTCNSAFQKLGLFHDVLNHIHDLHEIDIKVSRRHVTSDDPSLEQATAFIRHFQHRFV